MRLINCNYETWKSNHDEKHKDKIYRSLYPYTIFKQIDFDETKINTNQEIHVSYSKYLVNILQIELQGNSRYKATFFLKTEHNNFFTKWKYRTWEEKFQIIYTQNYEFVTVFTKNEDSSKRYLTSFFNGNFEKITINRSIPISELLFNSLASLLSENIFEHGDFDREFPVLSHGVRSLKIPKSFKKGRTKKEFVYPLFSINRDLWVFNAFTEEKAHKIAYFNCNQCKVLYVIYCNPVYTKHFRCNHENVFVVSLFEFSYIFKKEIDNVYSKQIRYLQNHLNDISSFNILELKSEIENPRFEEYEIHNSELLESLAIMKIYPTNNSDLLLYLSAMNLLNSWINRSRQKAKKMKLFRNMYFFKSYLADSILQILNNKSISDYRIYIEKDLIMIEIKEFQFSFHNVPMNDGLLNFLVSDNNIKFVWKGIRLQPISPLIYRLVKEMNKKSHNTVYK
jgi:hypothetical protein